MTKEKWLPKYSASLINMEFLKLSEIAAACGGVYSADCTVHSVCIDTRKITPGCLFICIKGERFDGHSFAQEALDKGAAAVMVHKKTDVSGNYVMVKDTSKALLALGGYYRRKFNISLVGLTGSVGKTTTKEFIYLALAAKYNTIKTQGNFNNEIGMPQMLFQIDSSTRAAVIEMGMNHFGEISRLSRAAGPNVGVITNIGTSHIENLGSRQGILRGKLELFDGLEKGGALILNGDDDMLAQVKENDYNIIFYGIESGEFRACDIKQGSFDTEFNACQNGKKTRIRIPAAGIHNVYNALAAFTVGVHLGVDADECAAALADYQPEGMRQKTVLAGGICFIEDCYNANPDSMAAAVNMLSNTDGSRKIAVLADMLELGDYSADAHAQVGKAVAEKGIDALFAYGKDAEHIAASAGESGMAAAEFYTDKDKLAKDLINFLKPGDTVIFKGSRGMRLEEVINKIYEVKKG